MPEGQRARAEYDDLPDGVVVADAAGRVVAANAAAERILRTPRDRLLGRPLDAALPLRDPQGRDWWACTRPFGGLRSRVRQPERLLLLIRDDGEEQPLLVTASFQRDDERKLSGVTVCLRDTLARSRHEHSAAELVSVVAHELRSPLTSVKGFTATLLGKWERFTDEQKRHMLTTVNADADRLTRLISELLDVSRIETGRLELHKQPVDLAELVQHDVAGRVAAGEPADRFRVEVAQPTPEVWADPDKLAQVIGNVIENALRHGAGAVTVAVAGRNGGVDVEVTDEGEGIPDEALPRVFGKFWRGGDRGGTGLGLFVAKGIIDAHGGTMTAGRAPAGGAAIGFTLPIGAPAG
ncbi:MAG TPA: ATP-binding protein [Mycobacteriales bacterium]|nr:ATP-binding protein [Mycobacteriales bacterium]